MDKRLDPPFSQKGWPWVGQELPQYNPYIHSGQHLQCSTTQLHRTQNRENIWKNQNGVRRNRFTTLQISIFSRIQECVRSKYLEDTVICRFLQGILLHTQREDEANNSRLRPSQRNRRSHNDGILKKTKLKVCSLDRDAGYLILQQVYCKMYKPRTCLLSAKTMCLERL